VAQLAGWTLRSALTDHNDTLKEQGRGGQRELSLLTSLAVLKSHSCLAAAFRTYFVNQLPGRLRLPQLLFGFVPILLVSAYHPS
jgi:hypothetical protein